jgi:hypothetical protein
VTSFQLFAVTGLTGAEDWLAGCTGQVKAARNLPEVPPPATIRFNPCFKAKTRLEIRKTLQWKALESLLDP